MSCKKIIINYENEVEKGLSSLVASKTGHIHEIGEPLIFIIYVLICKTLPGNERMAHRHNQRLRQSSPAGKRQSFEHYSKLSQMKVLEKQLRILQIRLI